MDLSYIIDIIGILGGIVYAIEKAVLAYAEYRKKEKDND